MKYIISLLTALLLAALTELHAATLTLAAPLDYQLIQRSAKAKGTINMVGDLTEVEAKSARALLDKSLRKIAAQVKRDTAKGIPVTIFNDPFWSRSGPVEMDLPPSATAASLRVVDADGKEIRHQLTTLGVPDQINVAAGEPLKVVIAGNGCPRRLAGC